MTSIFGIDFGTAYTKVQARDEEERLYIIRDITGKALTIPSEVYIDKAGQVYFGLKARDEHIEHINDVSKGKEGFFFSDIKIVLIHAAEGKREEIRKLEQEIRETLDTLKDPPGPFSIVTYSIAHSLAEAQKIFKKSFNKEISLDKLKVNFSHPSLQLESCFLTNPDNPGGTIRYEEYIKKAVARALYLSQYIKSDECTVGELMSHTIESMEFQEEFKKNLSWDYEPACAISEILKNYPEAEEGIYILIDIGAGTTDIGVLLKESPSNNELLLHYSEPIGDSKVDNILIEEIKSLQKKEIESLTEEKSQALEGLLKTRIRAIKEKLISDSSDELNLSELSLTPIELHLSMFESKLREGYLNQILEKLKQYLSNIREALVEKGYKQPIRKIFVSGGGSFFVQKYGIIEELSNEPVIYTSDVGSFSELSEEDMRLQVVALGLAHADVEPSSPPPLNPSKIRRIIKEMPDYGDKETQ